MKTIKIFLLAIMAITTLSCSNSDDSIETLDSLGQTEWKGKSDNNLEYYLYFSDYENQVSITQPKVYTDGTVSSITIHGTYTYTKPNANMIFTGECSNSGFVFQNCNVNATVNGNTVNIVVNGQNLTFTRFID